MKNYIVMLVLACVSMSLYAVNPIKEGNMIAGHVIVKGTEESIPFATVMILGTNRGAVSNEEGQFEFRKLAAGKYTLRVQVMGYKTQEKNNHGQCRGHIGGSFPDGRREFYDR